MGKKISQASVKISKKNHDQKKRQQLDSLIKVLKPKVYITDSSSFKSLVHELTGNGSIISAPVSPPSPSSSSPPLPVEISSCMEASSDTSTLDSFEPCSNYDQIFMELETATSTVEHLLMNQQETDLFAYLRDLDLDSWLLDMEPAAAAYSSCNTVSAQQEVSIYDYELAGLI